MGNTKSEPGQPAPVIGSINEPPPWAPPPFTAEEPAPEPEPEPEPEQVPNVGPHDDPPPEGEK